MDPVLKIEHLSISFTQYTRGACRRELSVIRDLSLEIHPGEIMAVVGASGSGKSLLAHAVMGVLPYNSHMAGEIFYEGEILTPKKIRAVRGKEIVLVPQGVTYLDPLMKVGRQLCGGKRNPLVKQKAEKALARYGLAKNTASLFPFQLSGGMARRVLMATAVMESPKLIIADEPTPGLDVQAASRMLGHFQELAAEGAGILFITHDLELALQVAHRVTVFYGGETVEEASVEDFYQNRLRHPFTQGLWDAMPQHGFVSLPGTQPYPGERQEGCAFADQCLRADSQCGKGVIPLKVYQNGKVRCLYPNPEEQA